MNIPQEAKDRWERHRPHHESAGVTFDDACGIMAYLPPQFKSNYRLAMDALPQVLNQPALSTQANSAVPAYLTTMIDPAVFKILFARNSAAVILGEQKKGTWVDETAMFPTVEHAGEVSSYGDFAESGHTSVNTNWPQRQAHLFQLIKEYGERELERAGLARINWVSEIDQAAATIMNKFSNLTYFYGVNSLENYGLVNDPQLTASLTPAVKAAGGTARINTTGVVIATPNEVFTDIQSMFYQLVSQTQGLVEADTKLVLAMSPQSEVALTATNSFNVNVFDILKKNFPNIRFETAVQYGVTNSTNPQGQAAGKMVQMIAEEVEGQPTGYCAYNEKMHAMPIIRQLSSYRQKLVGGTWGAILRQPFALVQLLGV
jgi:hypothetical protein